MKRNKPKIGIFGIGGLLGSRLALAIQNDPDATLAVGVAKADNTLPRLTILSETMQENPWANSMYLSEDAQTVAKVNKSQRHILFQEFNCASAPECDVWVDATPGGYALSLLRNFGKPIIAQSGAYPEGDLTILPTVGVEQNNQVVRRQGDCLLSALCPVLCLFKNVAERFNIHVNMLLAERLQDFPTPQRLNGMYVSEKVAKFTRQQLTKVFPEQSISVDVMQTPGIEYYVVTVRITTTEAVSALQVKNLLKGQARIYMAPDSVTSTYEIDHFIKEPLRSLGLSIPPIIAFGGIQAKQKTLKINLAIFNRQIAVLSNLDTIYMLACGLDPALAMLHTNKIMNHLIAGN